MSGIRNGCSVYIYIYIYGGSSLSPLRGFYLICPSARGQEKLFGSLEHAEQLKKNRLCLPRMIVLGQGQKWFYFISTYHPIGKRLLPKVEDRSNHWWSAGQLSALHGRVINFPMIGHTYLLHDFKESPTLPTKGNLIIIGRSNRKGPFREIW